MLAVLMPLLSGRLAAAAAAIGAPSDTIRWIARRASSFSAPRCSRRARIYYTATRSCTTTAEGVVVADKYSRYDHD